MNMKFRGKLLLVVEYYNVASRLLELFASNGYYERNRWTERWSRDS